MFSGVACDWPAKREAPCTDDARKPVATRAYRLVSLVSA